MYLNDESKEDCININVPSDYIIIKGKRAIHQTMKWDKENLPFELSFKYASQDLASIRLKSNNEKWTT